MKTLLVLASVSISGLVMGCNGHSTPGGPGATSSNTNPAVVGTNENTFTINTPALATDIKQGETKVISLGISRGKNFGQDVKLEITGAPQGVKVTSPSTEFKASQEKMEISIEATKDAALGEYVITLTGTPEKEGAKATSQLKINVKKAD